MDFQPLFKAVAIPQWPRFKVHAFIRTQFRIETFMVAGAILQIVLCALLPMRYALVPAVFLAFVRVVDVYAVKTGLKRNPHMDGNIEAKKFSAQFPDQNGNFGNQPARDKMALLIIGTRNNSPTGLFDKQFNKMGSYFGQMAKELQQNAEDHGFLGTSSWTGTERDTNPTLMNIMYFKSAEHVQTFAHGPLHMKAWNWWYKHSKENKHLSIFHEIYEVPAGNYESVYAQMPPMLAAATQHKVVQKTARGEESGWMYPMVDASKGQLKSSRGRMARSEGSENVKYGFERESTPEDFSEKTAV